MVRRKAIAVALVLPASVALVLWVLWRGYSGPAVVTVSNLSGTHLSDVQLEGNGFLESLRDLAPGDIATVMVAPRGESSLKVSFDLAGERVTKGDLTYIEWDGGYRTLLTIRGAGDVECRTDRGFSWARAVSVRHSLGRAKGGSWAFQVD